MRKPKQATQLASDLFRPVLTRIGPRLLEKIVFLVIAFIPKFWLGAKLFNGICRVISDRNNLEHYLFAVN